MLFKISRLSLALLCLFNGNVIAGQTTRVNVASDGAQANAEAYQSPSMSSNGRYVVFLSSAKNLPDNTRGSTGVFVHDRFEHKTERIDVGLNGSQANDSSNVTNPNISADGRYVVFSSFASNLVKLDTNNTADVFVYDRRKHTMEMASIIPDNIRKDPSIGELSRPTISSDGRYVAFAYALKWVARSSTINKPYLFVRDRLTHKTEQIHINWPDTKEVFSSDLGMSFSADGRYLAFSIGFAFHYGDGEEIPIDFSWGIFVYDRLHRKTETVLNDFSSIYDSGLSNHSVSADGRYVTFFLNNYYLPVPNTRAGVYIYDRQKHKTDRINPTVASKPGVRGTTVFSAPSISDDGHYIAFRSSFLSEVSESDAPVPEIIINDETHTIYDRHTQKMQSEMLPSVKIKIGHRPIMINADGRYIAFASESPRLVIKDTNKATDIFINDRLLDTTHHSDLTITTTTKPTVLKPNSQGTYLYTITNNGKDTVPDVSLIHLASGGSAVNFKPSQGTCNFSSAETVCHLGQLPAGKNITVHVTVKAQSKAINQQVTVSGAPVDTMPINNQVSVTTSVK